MTAQPIKLDGTGQDLGTGRPIQSAAGNYGSLADYAVAKNTTAAALTAAGWVFITPYDGTGNLVEEKWDGVAWVEDASQGELDADLAAYKVTTNRSIDKAAAVAFFTALASDGDGWMSVVYKTIEHLMKGFQALDVINDRDGDPLPENPPAYSRDSKSVTSLTQAAGTATATVTAHGYAVGELVCVGGANETEYNGWQTVLTTPDANSFTYAVDAAAASPATGTIVTQKKVHAILEKEAEKRAITVSAMADLIKPLADSQLALIADIAAIRPKAKDDVDAAADKAAIDTLYTQFQTDLAALFV